MINDDSIPSAGANVDSEPKDEVTTSSSNNTKPHVVGSQCTQMSLDNAIVALGYKENTVNLRTFSFFILHCLKNVVGFYEWIISTNNPKYLKIAGKISGGGFYMDLRQIRELYSSISSNIKDSISPSVSNTTAAL